MASKSSKPGGGGKKDDDLESFAKYEKEITKEVNKREAPTYITGKNIEANLEARSYFDVYELDLARDEAEPPLIIAGNDAQIALQASLIKAVDQLLTQRGYGPFNFKKWAEQFEDGFGAFTVNASPELKKMREGKDRSPWPGVPYGNRPKIVELKVPENVREKPDFKAVQFWPARDDKNTWHIFTGSYREIAAQIVNWWNQKVGETSADFKSKQPTVSGQPTIILYFLQDTDKIPQRPDKTFYPPLFGKISFRIMDKSDNPKSDLSKISRADIKVYAQKIKEQFAPSRESIYLWDKGKRTLCYNSPLQGFARTWYQVQTKQAGVDLVTKLLAITGQPLDKGKLRWGEAIDEKKAFPDDPGTATVLGEKIYLEGERRIGSVRFQRAEIKLPLRQKPIPLVRSDRIVFTP